MRNYAFQRLERPRLISLIRLGNGASVRVAEKIGMHRGAEVLQGETRYWVYALERQDALPHETAAQMDQRELG